MLLLPLLRLPRALGTTPADRGITARAAAVSPYLTRATCFPSTRPPSQIFATVVIRPGLQSSSRQCRRQRPGAGAGAGPGSSPAPTARLNPRAMFSSGAAKRTPPGPGQESVWDYPRPPRLEQTPKRIEIKFNGQSIADSRRAYRVLETSHPPVYYIPQEDIAMQYVHRSSGGGSFCEWKGQATYWTVSVGGKNLENMGWSYESPTVPFRPITSHIAFYCGPMEECLVDGERAQPQPGGFYGGWVTKDIVGPFKGGPGSWGW